MKEEKGITLLSLIIYIIALLLVISMLAAVSDMFFSNTQYITDSGKYIAEFNKFNMYFIEDVKNNKDTYEVTENSVIFEDGTQYTFEKAPDSGIYRNKVKICDNIEFCRFKKTEKTEENIIKNIVEVVMVIDSSKLFEVSNEYVLKYW